MCKFCRLSATPDDSICQSRSPHKKGKRDAAESERPEPWVRHRCEMGRGCGRLRVLDGRARVRQQRSAGEPGASDDQLGKISKALELLQRVVDLPQTETFPTVDEMYARKIYDRFDNEWGRGWSLRASLGSSMNRRSSTLTHGATLRTTWDSVVSRIQKGLEDVNGRPWSAKVKERRKRAFLSWGTSNPDEGIQCLLLTS